MVDLKEYPLAEALRERLTTAAEMERCINAVDGALAYIKAGIERDICAAVNESGKSIYPNEKARDAAVVRAVGEEEVYGRKLGHRNEWTFARAIALAESEAIKAAIKLACATARVGE